jgi:hypothetical protein
VRSCSHRLRYCRGLRSIWTRRRAFVSHAALRVLGGSMLLVIMLGAAQTSAQDGASESQQKKTIRGIVVNSVTHEPVARALVSSADRRLAAMTDEQGHFELTVPPLPASPGGESDGTVANAQFEMVTGNYFGMFMAFKPGFLNPQRNAMANQPVINNGKELTIAIVPEALIVGQIVLPANTGDRIEVNLYRRVIQEGRPHWISAGAQRSRANGEFRFFDLEPGTYKLLTSEMMDRDPLTFEPGGPMYGYPPAYFPHAVNFATAEAIQLKAGMTFQAELTPVRQRYYSVELPVTNGPSDGQLEVSVSMQGGKGPGYALGYDTRHQKISGSLPNGNYVIEAFSEGANPASGSMNIEVKGAAVQGPGMTLVPNGTVRVNAKLEFKNNPDTDVQPQGSATVVFHNGQAQGQNLNVRLEPVEDVNERNRSETRPPHGPDDESVILEHVRPGRYWIRVDSPRGFAAAISAGDVDLLRHPLTVRAGANLVVDVTMRDDGAEIAGSVEGLDGASGGPDDGTLRSRMSIGFAQGAQAHVYCVPLPESTGQFREAWVAPDGKFSLQRLPPGAYRVLAFNQPQNDLEYQDAASMRAYEGKGQVVRLAAGQKEELKLQVISGNE